MRRFGLHLGVVAAVSAAVVWWAIRGSGVTPAPRAVTADALLAAPAGTPAPVKIEARPASFPPPDGPYHGMSWVIHNSKWAVEEARLLLPQIAELGADTVLISNAGCQEHAGSEKFDIDPEVTPTRQQWREIFTIARQNRLRIVLMPIVLLTDPRGDEWRGVINPPSWDDWWEQYSAFILAFAGLAAENHVEVFSVGSELVSTETDTRRWRALIAQVRKVYPGKLTYSANWDHYKVIEFWDLLDLIGMTSYYKLSSDPGPTLETLMAEWAPIKRGILMWQKSGGAGKPLLFTEVGWASQEGTSIEPWNYYRKPEATAAGLEEQRRCYRAFMETWKDTPQVGGVIWWEWANIPGGPTDFGYSPKGKPAEKELREWFKAVREQRSAATRPAN
ncbi:MAG: hypothetical protein HRF43_10980 [Phycisphaerae bacterium]